MGKTAIDCGIVQGNRRDGKIACLQIGGQYKVVDEMDRRIVNVLIDWTGKLLGYRNRLKIRVDWK